MAPKKESAGLRFTCTSADVWKLTQDLSFGLAFPPSMFHPLRSPPPVTGGSVPEIICLHANPQLSFTLLAEAHFTSHVSVTVLEGSEESLHGPSVFGTENPHVC